MTFRLEPRARRKMYRTASWHERRRTGYGDVLLDACSATFRLIARHPGIGTPVDAELRRLGLSRFPYTVIYRARTGEIVVFAIAHHKPRPGYWRRRLTGARAETRTRPRHAAFDPVPLRSKASVG